MKFRGRTGYETRGKFHAASHELVEMIPLFCDALMHRRRFVDDSWWYDARTRADLNSPVRNVGRLKPVINLPACLAFAFRSVDNDAYGRTSGNAPASRDRNAGALIFV